MLQNCKEFKRPAVIGLLHRFVACLVVPTNIENVCSKIQTIADFIDTRECTVNQMKNFTNPPDKLHIIHCHCAVK